MFDGTRISPRKGLRGRKAIASLRRGFVDEVLDLHGGEARYPKGISESVSTARDHCQDLGILWREKVPKVLPQIIN